MASLLAYARDTFLHVCTTIVHLLHLDQVVALEPPPNSTVTVETLSPRAFSHKTVQAPPCPAAPAPAPTRSKHGEVDVSEITTTQPETTDDVETSAHDLMVLPTDHDLMVLPTDHDLMVLPTKQSETQGPEAPRSTKTESARAPAAPTENTHTPEDRSVAAVNPTAHETVPEDIGSGRDLLGAAAAAGSASAGDALAELPSLATARDKARPPSDTTDDLDRVSTESNATDDTEEDRVRALDQSFGGGERSNVQDKRRAKKHKSKDKPKPKRPSRQSAPRGSRRRRWSSSSSSDNEDALKAELYAASPRCVPPLTRESLTSM